MRKMAEFVKFILKTYLAFFLACLMAPLGIKVIENPKAPASFEFLAVLSLGLPAVGTVIAIIYFFYITSHRKRDPYRFSERQHRFFKVPQTTRLDLMQVLQNLGYTCHQGTADSDQIKITATRKLAQLPKDFLRERANEKDPRPEQTLILTGRTESGAQHIDIECFATKRLIAGDYSQTTYFSLEEIIDALSWEKYLIDAQGNPINRRWERLDA